MVAGLRGAYPSIIAGVFGPVESGPGHHRRPARRRRGRRRGLRRRLGRGPGMVSQVSACCAGCSGCRWSWSLLIVLAGALARSRLQWTVAGRAGGRRRARLGAGLRRCCGGCRPGWSRRCSVVGDGRLRGLRGQRRGPGRRRRRRPAHARPRRRPQRRAAPAHRADPGRAAARHRARPGRAGLAGRLRRRRARRPGPPPGAGAAAADAALRRCPGAGRARTPDVAIWQPLAFAAAGRARPRRRRRHLRRRARLPGI